MTVFPLELTVVAGNALPALQRDVCLLILPLRPRDALHPGVGAEVDAVALEAVSQPLHKGLEAVLEAVHRPLLLPLVRDRFDH